MDDPFPCNFMIYWKNDKIAPLIIGYTVYQKYNNFEKTIMVNFGGSESKRKPKPVEYDWYYRDTSMHNISIVNIN